MSTYHHNLGAASKLNRRSASNNIYLSTGVSRGQVQIAQIFKNKNKWDSHESIWVGITMSMTNAFKQVQAWQAFFEKKKKMHGKTDNNNALMSTFKLLSVDHLNLTL